jgi:hypothetical protein
MKRCIEMIKSDLLLRYSSLGHEINEEWELIGKAPHIAPLAWLHRFYKGLSDDQIALMENQIRMRVPNVLRDLFYETNGLKFFNTTFSISGYVYLFKREIGYWQPFSIKTDFLERPKNATQNQFYFGGWDWDGSKAYLDIETNKVYRCARRDASPLNEWDNLEKFLLTEYERLVSIHDEEGKPLNPNLPTTPNKQEYYPPSKISNHD